jgi:hypothetical protein
MVDRRIGLCGGERTILEMGQVAGIGAVAERRIFCRFDVVARLRGGTHMRRNDAERAGVEDALHVG